MKNEHIVDAKYGQSGYIDTGTTFSGKKKSNALSVLQMFILLKSNSTLLKSRNYAYK